jgi:hypothetical protein
MGEQSVKRGELERVSENYMTILYASIGSSRRTTGCGRRRPTTMGRGSSDISFLAMLLIIVSLVADTYAATIVLSNHPLTQSRLVAFKPHPPKVHAPHTFHQK